MNINSINSDHQLVSMETKENNNDNGNDRGIIGVGSSCFSFSKCLQIIHFTIVISYLCAGLIEFVNNPPIFDGYGDALSKNKLPEGILQDNPVARKSGNLRIMDLPILAIVLGYFAVSAWLKFEGLSWLLTISVSLAFLCFCIVNFWAQDYFNWSYYSDRISGLELQVSSLALCATNILMVMFYSRKKMPFKFKSSIRIRQFGAVHVLFNFASIFLIMFTSMLLWFTKMYISWSCFKTHFQVLELCQITNQVQCYSCKSCNVTAMKKCYQDNKQFSCNVKLSPRDPETQEGAFCVFNYNLSGVQFLTIIAYIGGLCVFLSTIIRIFGHYILRVMLIVFDSVPSRCLPRCCKQKSSSFDSLVIKSPGEIHTEEMVSPISHRNDIYNGSRSSGLGSPTLSNNDGGNFFDASCG